MYQLTKQGKFDFLRLGVTMFVLALVCFGQILASPPHPDLLKTRSASQSLSTIPNSAELHARGINLPEDCFGIKTAGKDPQASATALGTFRVLALLVDFSDHVSQVNASFFDTLMFASTGSSVHDYFNEISYTQIDLVTVDMPSGAGWNRAPQTYEFYVDSLNGLGTYPRNTQKLVEDLVDAVDAQVDFGPYDNDGDGDVDVLLVIHSGSGAEFSGSLNDIWSHKWGISPRATSDGVWVGSYTIQPEFWNSAGDMTIGVYCHELLHGFGLPDLYDTGNPFTEDVTSGIGRWGIMATGSWNGPFGLGSSPAHPCAWSRAQLGITTPVNVTGNLSGQAIGQVNTGGSVYRLWTSGVASDEYFLVENRQKTGFDSYLPGSGLLVWHIDDAKTNNREEWYPGLPGAQHRWVALEQADGLYELDHLSGGNGDADDSWPGNLNRTLFNGASFPSSDGYLSGGSFVAVDNISASAATMYADLIVGVAASVGDDDNLLPGKYSLEQNYPNPFNPATRIDFTLVRSQEVRLDIINLLGEQVRTLVSGEVSAGPNSIEWDGTNNSGTTVSSGVYFYRLAVGDETSTRKMMLIK